MMKKKKKLITEIKKKKVSVKPEAAMVKHLSAKRVTSHVAKLPKQEVHPR